LSIEYIDRVDIEAMKRKIIDDRKRLLGVALEDAASEIKQRSFAGKDVSGSTFKPLSPTYKKYKLEKTGRSTADMLLEGKMLAAIQTKVEEYANGLLGIIFFGSAKEAEKAAKNQKTRKFFGLAKDQIARIAETLRGN
jgi:hypothetical protein